MLSILEKVLPAKGAPREWSTPETVLQILTDFD